MFKVHVQVYWNVNRYKCHKTLHNTNSWNNKHMLLYSSSPLCIAVRLARARHVFSSSLHDFIGCELREMNLMGRILSSVLNLPSSSTCQDFGTLNNSINSHLPARKICVSSERSRSFHLYFYFFWIFPCSLNKIKPKVACWILQLEELMQLFLRGRITLINELGSQDSYAPPVYSISHRCCSPSLLVHFFI
jgi:hypothetical protein